MGKARPRVDKYTVANAAAVGDLQLLEKYGRARSHLFVLSLSPRSLSYSPLVGRAFPQTCACIIVLARMRHIVLPILAAVVG